MGKPSSFAHRKMSISLLQWYLTISENFLFWLSSRAMLPFKDQVSPTCTEIHLRLCFSLMGQQSTVGCRGLAEMITIRFAGWISGRIVSFQPDTDIQNVFFCGIRIRIRISGSTCLIRYFENAGSIGCEMNFGHLWPLGESCTLRTDFSVCGCILLALRAIHTSESMV